jgi:hypothetical protein
MSSNRMPLDKETGVEFDYTAASERQFAEVIFVERLPKTGAFLKLVLSRQRRGDAN